MGLFDDFSQFVKNAGSAFVKGASAIGGAAVCGAVGGILFPGTGLLAGAALGSTAGMKAGEVLSDELFGKTEEAKVEKPTTAINNVTEVKKPEIAEKPSDVSLDKPTAINDGTTVYKPAEPVISEKPKMENIKAPTVVKTPVVHTSNNIPMVNNNQVVRPTVVRRPAAVFAQPHQLNPALYDPINGGTNPLGQALGLNSLGGPLNQNPMLPTTSYHYYPQSMNPMRPY